MVLLLIQVIVLHFLDYFSSVYIYIMSLTLMPLQWALKSHLCALLDHFFKFSVFLRQTRLPSPFDSSAYFQTKYESATSVSNFSSKASSLLLAIITNKTFFWEMNSDFIVLFLILLNIDFRKIVRLCSDTNSIRTWAELSLQVE